MTDEDLNDVYGTDFWLGLNTSEDPDTQVNPAGDLSLATGRECLRQAIIRRLITSPGEWATMPDYGVGARDFVKERYTPDNVEALKSRIRAQLIQDPRISRVDAIQIENNDGLLKIAVRVSVKQLGDASPVYALLELR